jgi:hypothetical protein
VCRPSAPIIAIVRDPVERFASALRHLLGRSAFNLTERFTLRALRSEALWAGMYAQQLEAWSAIFGRKRLVVIQHEWARGGIDPSLWPNFEDSPRRTQGLAGTS